MSVPGRTTDDAPVSAEDWTTHFSQLFTKSTHSDPTSLHATMVAAAPDAASSRTVTLFVSAFLTRTRNVHKGAFAFRHHGKGGKSPMQRSVEELVDGSPGLCHGLRDGTARLLILHDQPAERWQPAADTGVELHVVSAEASAGPGLGNDRRWLLF